MKNTLMLNLYSLVLTFPLPILMALLFNQFRRLKVRKVFVAARITCKILTHNPCKINDA